VARSTPDRLGPKVERAVVAILELLGKHPPGLLKRDIARRCKVSPETVQRALDCLREEHGAPIAVRSGVWRLTEPFSLPWLSPQPDDLTALTIAGALLRTFADPDLDRRIDSLVAELDERLRDAGREGLVPAGGVSASMSFGTRLDRKSLETILKATRGGVIAAEHRRVWGNGKAARSPLRLEPWHCRVHDGIVYVRGFARDRGEPRTYRIVDLDGIKRLHGVRAKGRRPPPDKIWGDGDPAFGIDHDRPGTARIVVEGALARWVEPIVFHPDQGGDWLEPDARLERTIPYRSCRELARRLLAIVDGLVEVEPEELRAEMGLLVKAAHDRALIMRMQ
jgi:predicted DNA-binding transcriptional regulator YafY